MKTIVKTSSVSLDTILKSKEIYNTAFDLSAAPQAIVSLDRRIMRANRAFTRLTGYNEIDLISLTLQDILIPDADAKSQFLGPDLEIGAGTQIETDYIRKNGTIRRGRFWFHLMKDRETGPVCWILIMEDLTASIAADEAVRDYNQLFTHFISNNNDCILFLDTEGKILYMNKTACRLMGVAGMDDALQRKFAEYFNGLEKTAIDMAIQLAARGMGGNFQGCLAGQNEPAWLDVDITAVAGESKKVERLMVLTRDITAQKKAEQALIDMKKEMERKEREAAELLARERERHEAEKRELEETAARAAAALSEKETLLREIHHRVKNNMQAISCLINLQSAQVEDRNVARMFEQCRERISSMSKVHEKLSTSENPSHINFHEYTAELASEMLNSHGKNGRVSIVTDIDDIFLGIKEAIPCGLLMTEIMSNAMKYAFPGEKTGKVTIRFKRSGRGMYTLTIADNGIGLPGGIDLENATTLGMELIRELTKQIKGSVSVVSNGGTAYTIRFKGNSVSGAA
jgi:PAS domain S-box-containing protein